MATAAGGGAGATETVVVEDTAGAGGGAAAAAASDESVSYPLKVVYCGGKQLWRAQHTLVFPWPISHTLPILSHVGFSMWTATRVL